MTIRKPVVAANWKMNGKRHLVDEFVRAFSADDILNQVDVILSTPATLLSYAQQQCEQQHVDLILAGQNMSRHSSGAHTGEISAELFKDVGCSWVLCGHSERRNIYGERSELTAQKFLKAQKLGLTPVLCVGESEEERNEGHAFSRLTAQIEEVINLAGKSCFRNAIIAYEPIWAIGTGRAATPEIAQEAHKFIRGMVAAMCSESADSVRIIYGGSVTRENARALFEQPDIDGGLIGGASLVPKQFKKICAAAL